MKIFKSILLIFLLSLVGYMSVVEPLWIETTFHRIDAPVEKRVRILQLTDLHMKDLGFVEKKVLRLVKDLHPDLIVLTGDITSSEMDEKDSLHFLSKLTAPQGVFFVSGYKEYWSPHNQLGELLKKAGVTNLNNLNYKIQDNLFLVGLDDALKGKLDEYQAFQGIPAHAIKIAIFHTPTHFDLLYKKINIALSGHTHGGQIRLPTLAPIWLPAGSGTYDQGWFKKETSSMYVSRGIGMTGLPFRLLSRPEIAVFDIE
jgi:uncharacterized protein